MTEIIGYKAVPGLPWGAAKETALYAVNSFDEWRDLLDDAATDVLRLRHRAVWDSHASIGTALHAVNEAWDAGTEVDLDALVCDMADSDKQAKLWQGHEAETVDRLEGYVDGLEKFWNVHRPIERRCEECVRTPNVYVGQRDMVATINWRGAKSRVLLDIKTTHEQDPEKAVYHDSWALQLAAYRYAEECVGYALNDAGKVVETGAWENDPVDACAVIHLRGDGGFTLYEVAADEDAYQAFLALASFGRWDRALKAPRTVEESA
ncbi:MAG TPA: PD-(D/E)XK nuclease family protein [Mycobacteriales bacterium]